MVARYPVRDTGLQQREPSFTRKGVALFSPNGHRVAALDMR